jgi:hypothetical protein
MALVLVKEDGTGKVDANSYATAADGDAYHDGHLYATAWTTATLAKKEAALVMATRLIDSQYLFGGGKTHETQALQWPREGCRDLDAGRWSERTIINDLVPKALVEATCEMARELIVVDRTAAPVGEGLSYRNIAGDQTGYSKSDVRPIISHVAQAMLAKFGALIKSRSGSVPLTRV